MQRGEGKEDRGKEEEKVGEVDEEEEEREEK